ncbi:hypothetical protein [Providencia phage PSTRCR_114]|uniref:Uncharacterized protein n=1 Tax=Providencia phage PSTRCR_114 TaxID=2800824 RepID=A0A7T7CL47_9CAUD|nr:hypothetical protein [Providencia phage PSTRCR_114]
MDIKDVKVGMLVQLNDNSSKQGCVGMVESIDYLDALVMLRLEGVITASGHNTSTVHNRWNVRPYRFEEYQDPEADMVVWDALEIGEHYVDSEGYERVKLSERTSYCFQTRTIHPHYGTMDKYEKVKPL